MKFPFVCCMNRNVLQFISLHRIPDAVANQKTDIRNHAHTIVICSIFVAACHIPQTALCIMRIMKDMDSQLNELGVLLWTKSGSMYQSINQSINQCELLLS